MKNVKKALAAAVISVACGSAMASTIPYSSVSVNSTTDVNIETYRPLDPIYYELAVGGSDTYTRFTLIDTAPETRTVNYELYFDDASAPNSYTLGTFIDSWSYTDLLGDGTVTGVTKLLNANTQYVLKMFTNNTTAGTVTNVAAVPLPAAAWLFGSALLGMGLFRRRKQADLAAV